MHKFDKNPCMDFKGELCSERNATQRNATQRNATQRNATQRNSTIIFNGKVIVWDSCFVFSVIMPQNNRKPPLFVS
ncbi:hypothetical protein TUM19854C_04130 [Neisseria gonorrhoeae]|nr:hypothetical protein NGCG_00645 [Neisseria gonorrhoeae DGI18]KMY05349.1 hypothetical protein NGIG_01411 [Neisseria gonorrhoeae PID24-1]CFA83684.1 Uncharacterised protein [Neisseria gonorrhoeae]SBM85648.1 Uncharacterised protein [Neisseria gonorrhoeae]SBO63099.1 Uncharacterised protein [Neisseria gonorrhoeae]